MTRRIFQSISAVAITVTMSAILLTMGLMYGYFSDAQMSRLAEETEMVARGVSLMGQDYIDSLAPEENRITWISADGTVLYDSHYTTADMENHSRREEITEAFSTGYGESIRFSDTLTQQYLYCARRLADGTVVRLSVSQNSVFALIGNMVQPVAFIVLAAVAIAVVLATRLSKSIINPLNSLNLDNPLSNTAYDELSPLLRRIHSQQKELKLQAYELQKKKDELDTVTGSMNEGIILLKANGYVISINSTAKRLLELTGRVINKDFLTLCRNTDINTALESALSGTGVEKIIDLAGGRYQLNASAIMSDGQARGAALLFFDVTEREKNEQLRREFTANVSHELKSPLHAISGYSELIMAGMATGEDARRFAGRIHSEAQRMSRTIQDIISLSQLDEGEGDMTRRPVDLYSVAHSVTASLAPVAENAQVQLEVAGESTLISGIPHLIHSIVYNLCDNAIKYNRPGGTVTISVYGKNGEAVLSVEDTGIGIAAEHQELVFQRFYRVDKSRSKEQGGSGLGLSIVKHAARLHNAKTELTSTPGKGTKIKITFPA